MEQGGTVVVGAPGRFVCRVCYAAPGKCPACGCHLPGGVEVVVVEHGRDDVEERDGKVIVHGVDGDVVFDHTRVCFLRFQPDREPRRR